MTQKQQEQPGDSPNQPKSEASLFQITVEGHLNGSWSEWLDDLTITQMEDGTTILTGPLIDQAALYGLLIKLRDLGLTLLSVERAEGEG